MVAARGQVWIQGEDGRTLGHLRDSGGGRASLSGVSSIAVAEDGGIWVVEPPHGPVWSESPGCPSRYDEQIHVRLTVAS